MFHVKAGCCADRCDPLEMERVAGGAVCKAVRGAAFGKGGEARTAAIRLNAPDLRQRGPDQKYVPIREQLALRAVFIFEFSFVRLSIQVAKPAYCVMYSS